jgi:phytoene desaturase
MTTTSRSIAIVGAGVGGLAAAARLAHAGHRVTVFEKNAVPGGRAGQLMDRGYTWDIGPTILLMRDVVEGLFADLGRDPADYLQLTQVDPNYRIHFGDGTSAAFTPDLARIRPELDRLEPGSFKRYLDLLRFGRHSYDTSVNEIINRPLDSVFNYLNPSLLKHVLSMKAHRRLYSYLSGFFKDERLLQALSFQTMYLGISPYEAPATFLLLPYTELAMGIWFPKGGMYAVPKAIERLGRELGVTYRYKAPVDRILQEGKQVTGVRLADGTIENFDIVVANADLPYTYQKLIPEATLPRKESLKYTSSAFMLYLGVDRKYEMLEHHNVVFGKKYRDTFKEIFDDKKLPSDPSFYVNRPSKTDPTLAPPGGDALYVLVPVPHQTKDIDWAKEGQPFRDRIVALIEQRLGVTDLNKHIRVEHWMTPDGWQQQFNLQHGAAFGLSHGFSQVGALRPSTRDAKFKNLYFVGASTQPGTGVPLVMISGQIVAERIARELGELPDSGTGTPKLRAVKMGEAA